MVGQRVSHYEILDEIAAGGMGVVYRARDLKLGRAVALKFIHPHLTGGAEGARQRFLAEARATGALDHPNIATIYEIDEGPDGRLFIAMAFYDAEPLSERCARERMAVDEAIAVAAQVADGLAAAHAAGIVHRDIKPSNILVDRSCVAKVIDFGIAKLADETLHTRTGALLGTVAYMAPEQLDGATADARTDVWAVGVM